MLVRLLMMTFILTSCSGTIEEKNPEITINAKTAVDEIIFAGIEKLEAVAHDKMEVYFFPASGGEQSINYLVYVNGGSPIELNPSSLVLNPEGMYVYTIEDLVGQVGVPYTISVGLKDKESGNTSNINKSLSGTTFGNRVANFGGILSATPRDGLLGQSEIIVSWIPAVTTGVSILPKSEDPIAYSICFAKKSAGTSVELSEGKIGSCRQLPLAGDLPTNPQNLRVSYENQRVITGLESNTEYYFLVRTLHKNYVINSSDPTYRTEMNNKAILAKTKSVGATIFWDQIMSDLSPDGSDGRTKRKILWNKAQGGFHSYRVYFREILDENDNVPADNLINFYASSNAKIDNIAINNFHNDPASIEGDLSNPKRMRNIEVAAESVNAVISGLTEFSAYTYKVVLCHTATCVDGERSIPPNEGIFTAIANLAPFNGIRKVNDPSELSKIDEVNFEFDPPVVSKGYLDSMDVICYENNGSPVKLTTTAKVGGKCDKIKLKTVLPTTLTGLNSFEVLNNVVIEKEGGWFDGSSNFTAEQFCFSIVPVIDDPRALALNEEAQTNAVKKCKNIYKRVPTIDQFPGANFACDTSIDSIDVSYPTPSGGIYSHYSVFWREIENGETFKFSEAKLENPEYGFAHNIATNTFTIPGLQLGRIYSFGVLSYFESSGGDKNYSDTNANIITCKLRSPIPEFKEWVNIFAIGPKSDGRRDRMTDPRVGSFLYERPTLLETIDNDGRPIEVEVGDYFNNDFTPTDTGLSGSVTPENFDGIFGRLLNEELTSDPSDPLATPRHQYSNSGIVRLVWKDIEFSAGVGTMKSYTDTEVGATKNQRKFGYKVMRSEDGGLKWIDLTKSGDGGHPNQINSGLIHPRAYIDLIRPNVTPASDESFLPDDGGSFNAGVFVDYSVQSLPSNGLVSRAREYLYKIVPVFNGEELIFTREDSNPQNIIKVTLPPKDMALVHRLIANRDACRELGKTYSTLVEENYNCDYNGLGAKWVDGNLALGQTKYDLGGDLLVDRNEMGCDYTRGATEHTSSSLSASKQEFAGKATNNKDFQGCFFGNNGQSLSGVGYSQAVDLSNGYASDNLKHLGVRLGDCVFDGSRPIISHPGLCPNTTTDTLGFQYFTKLGFPGALNITQDAPEFGPYDCESPELLRSSFLRPYKDLAADTDPNIEREALPSESLAVGYHRSYGMGLGHNGSGGAYRAARGSQTNGSRIRFNQEGTGNNVQSTPTSSSCMINIPVKDSQNGGVHRSRWIAANALNDLAYIEDINNDNTADTITQISLLNKTVGQLIDRTTVKGLFDSSAGARNDIPNILLVPDKSKSRGRYNGATPISRIISSPSAKLPPMTGLSLTDASTVCNSYEVEVGTYTDSSFKVTEAKAKKSIMERYEGIIASRFPTHLEEDADSTDISSIENTNADFSCNSISKNIPVLSTARVNQDLISLTLAAKSAETVNPYVITGSSELDNTGGGTGRSTQNCVSKFGIQDLVGNLPEMSAETIHCNHSQDLMVRPQGDTDLFRAASLPPLVFPNPQSILVDSRLDVFVPANLNLGSCSVAETGQSRTPATFQSASSAKPVFDIFGTFNSSMITDETGMPKREAFNSLRSGDGFFLDFGNTSIMPRLLTDNALSLDKTYHRYFNPVLGLPLICASGCDNDAVDNKGISTQQMVTDASGVVDSTIQDFYVGDAEYVNVGVGSYIKGDGVAAAEFYTTKNSLAAGERDFDFDYVFGIRLDSTPAGPYSSANILTYSGQFSGVERNILDNTSTLVNDYVTANPDDFVPETSGSPGVTAAGVFWQISRGSSQNFVNFGSAKTAGSRYSLTVNRDYREPAIAGFRCAVKINKD